MAVVFTIIKIATNKMCAFGHVCIEERKRVCVCVCARARICACMCACVREYTKFTLDHGMCHFSFKIFELFVKYRMWISMYIPCYLFVQRTRQIIHIARKGDKFNTQLASEEQHYGWIPEGQGNLPPCYMPDIFVRGFSFDVILIQCLLV